MSPTFVSVPSPCDASHLRGDGRGPARSHATDYLEAGRAVAKLIIAGGFAPVSVDGIDQSIRIEVGGDLHEFGKLGRLVTASEAASLV
jgi:hypothetical protein